MEQKESDQKSGGGGYNGKVVMKSFFLKSALKCSRIKL